MRKLSIIVLLALTGVLTTVLPVLAVNPVSSIQVVIAPGTAANTSDVALSWHPVTPVTTGDTISYAVYKSTDGGNTYGLLANLNSTTLTYTDSGVANYTDVNYKVTVQENGVSPGAADRVSTVYPPDTSPHANYTDNTNACSLCHKTHTGVGAHLLNQTTTLAVCQTCHWGSGTNSKYNVKDGETAIGGGGRAPDLAGPLQHTAYPGDQWGGLSTTSAHSFDQSPVIAPGGYNAAQALTCTSCHDAHDTGNYRLIRSSISYPNGPNTTTTATVSFSAYPVASNPTTGETANYISGSVTLCAACHSDFNAPSGSGHTPASGTFVTDGMYRHSMGVAPGSYTGPSGMPEPLTTSLPLEGTNPAYNQNKIMCLTCHYAHGTVRSGTSISSVTGSPSTMLRRRDNMGVCEDCHKK